MISAVKTGIIKDKNSYKKWGILMRTVKKTTVRVICLVLAALIALSALSAGIMAFL